MTKPLELRRKELERSLVREVITHDCVTTDPETSLHDEIKLIWAGVG